MKKTTALLLILIAILLNVGVAQADTDTVSEPLPDITLTVPNNQAFIDYMGLKWGPGTPFKLSDIDADILMVELFSMYCPYCQKAAPNVNELYELMQKNQRPGLKLVLIGIGVKNTPLEVETFRQGYDIKFPLFSDMDLSIYKLLGGDGTPTFVACKKEGGRKVIFFRKSGGFANPPQFFENLLSKSGLQ